MAYLHEGLSELERKAVEQLYSSGAVQVRGGRCEGERERRRGERGLHVSGVCVVYISVMCGVFMRWCSCDCHMTSGDCGVPEPLLGDEYQCPPHSHHGHPVL